MRACKASASALGAGAQHGESNHACVRSDREGVHQVRACLSLCGSALDVVAACIWPTFMHGPLPVLNTVRKGTPAMPSRWGGEVLCSCLPCCMRPCCTGSCTMSAAKFDLSIRLKITFKIQHIRKSSLQQDSYPSLTITTVVKNQSLVHFPAVPRGSITL